MVLAIWTADIHLTGYAVTRTHKLGVQLHQLSSGNEGLTLGDGTVVVGTEEAMQRELKNTWERMRGAEGDAFRANVLAMRGLMRKSWETGMTREAMLQVVHSLPSLISST